MIASIFWGLFILLGAAAITVLLWAPYVPPNRKKTFIRDVKALRHPNRCWSFSGKYRCKYPRTPAHRHHINYTPEKPKWHQNPQWDHGFPCVWVRGWHDPGTYDVFEFMTDPNNPPSKINWGRKTTMIKTPYTKDEND